MPKIVATHPIFPEVAQQLAKWGKVIVAISPRLLAQRDRTLFTPHLGSAVRDTRVAIEQMAANAIIAVLRGAQPENAVNYPSQAA
jgi:lactate dehydrogenase-like 2-hydroxyacid dehydrogenase